MKECKLYHHSSFFLPKSIHHSIQCGAREGVGGRVLFPICFVHLLNITQPFLYSAWVVLRLWNTALFSSCQLSFFSLSLSGLLQPPFLPSFCMWEDACQRHPITSFHSHAFKMVDLTFQLLFVYQKHISQITPLIVLRIHGCVWVKKPFWAYQVYSIFRCNFVRPC